MKTFLAGLQNSVQTTYANNGKTTILGRASQKTINGQSVIGPALTQFIDVETLAGFAPTFVYHNPATNHLFALGPVSANPIIALFTFNTTTGAYAYVGKVTLSLANAAATTEVWRGFKVYEVSGVIYPLISSTGSVVINGGTFVGWNLAASDFTIGGTTIYAASGSNQKAVYFLQDPAALGSAHVATTSWGLSLPQQSSSSGVNTKVWQWNGTLALPVLYSWDLSLTPTVAGIITNGVSAQTTLYAGTSPSAFFTMGSSNNGYANGDPVVLINGTGNVPTAFTAWAAGTLQVAATNVYFVRDLQLVSGNYYFNLASTTGGAAITPTSSTSSFTMIRAFGTNSSLFSLKTGTLPAFTLGAIIQANSVGYAKPVSAPANTALNGQDCLYMVTTTGLYMGKISDLSSLGTTWASMTFTGVNNTGTGTDYVGAVNAFGAYSGQNNTDDVDQFLTVSTGSNFIMKPYQNSNISASFGGADNGYYETNSPTTVPIGCVSPAGLHTMNGWVFYTSSSTGQRGIIFFDLYSDAFFANTSVITEVLYVPPGTILEEVSSFVQLSAVTNKMTTRYIRSASTSTDPVFSSATGGWALIPVGVVGSSVAIGPYYQIMNNYSVIGMLGSPPQINDFLISCFPPGEQSDYWLIDNDLTTQGTGSPSYVVGYLQQAYASSVPTIYARVYDLSGNLIFNANTSANPTDFQYSTNGGTSWIALGTIPNTVATLLRVLVTPTPAVLATPSFRET